MTHVNSCVWEAEDLSFGASGILVLGQLLSGAEEVLPSD